MDENDRELTPEEAQAAWDAAEPVPISEERIREIVDYVLRRRGRVFTHCNVCGTPLPDPEPNEMGMCEGCANL